MVESRQFVVMRPRASSFENNGGYQLPRVAMLAQSKAKQSRATKPPQARAKQVEAKKKVPQQIQKIAPQGSAPAVARSKTVDKKVKDQLTEDITCPVCCTFVAQPVVTPCKHLFCYQCSKAICERGLTCPMCRANFDKLFEPAIDRALEAEIIGLDKEGYEERKKELIKEGDWKGNSRTVKFSFGNTAQEVQKPKKAPNGAPMNTRWTMFVTLNNDEAATNRYIKSVTYNLHHTYQVNKIKLTEAPFLLSRVAWGSFEIKIDIEFQPWTLLGSQQIKHMLDFSEKGKTQSFCMEVDEKTGLQKNNGTAKQFKSLISRIKRQYDDGY